VSRLVELGRFAYEFVVGDDATIAVAVVVALALTGAFPGVGGGAFWIVPLAVAGVLTASLVRVARKPQR
jgi:hypothetical protein